MAYFALIYDVVADYLEKRVQFREEHLGLARKAHEAGELVMAGAFTEPSDRALFVFRGADKSAAEAFAKSDPYVKNGLVKKWEARSWNVVIGG